MKRILGEQGTIRSQGGKLFLAWLVGALAASGHAVAAGSPSPAVPRVSISGMPLNFERNLGQAPDEVQYLAHGPSYAIELSAQGAALGFAGQGSLSSGVVRLRVQGANGASRPAAEAPLPGYMNYFIGNDPSRWRSQVATFGKVRYPAIYPGIDLVYYGTQGRLEYDFDVAPGADPRDIRVSFDGAERLTLDRGGNLHVTTHGHDVVFDRPVAYQHDDRRHVAARYRVHGRSVSFDVGHHDPHQNLVIDPVLDYFTYLGGSGSDIAGLAAPTGSPFFTTGQTAALDRAGNLYVTGYTGSTDFPVKAAYESAPAKIPGGSPPSAFVTKFAPDGKTVIFSTYLGGTVGSDLAASIAVDSNGNAIVVGNTGSSDFPVTSGAYQTVCNPKFTVGSSVPLPNCPGGGGIAAFVTKFSPSGTLLYSTFLSGSNTGTNAYAVAVDTTGQVYVAGLTFPGTVVPTSTSANPQIPFPTTAGAVLATPPYSTGVGGYQNVLSAEQDAFISVFDPTLSTLKYSSLFGEPQVSNAGLGFEGASFTVGEAVTVDAAGNFYLAGISEDASLETTAGAYEANASSCGTVTDNTLLNCAFVAKFSPVPVGSGTPHLIYATYLGHTVGGSYGDLMSGIAADAAGDLYVAGWTNQATFPTTPGVYQTTCNQYGVNGNTDSECASAFIAKLNPNGTALLTSTYFGGTGASGVTDNVTGVGPIVLDTAGNVYISGTAANGLAQVNPLGSNDGVGGAVSPFVAEFNPGLTTLLFSTLFSTGGQSQIAVDGLALDTTGDIYAVGSVGSPPNSAATPGAFQSTYGGGSTDAFVAKISNLPFYASGDLTIPTITLGAVTYSNVVVTIGSLVSGPTGTTPNGSSVTYSAATGELTVPEVSLGSTVYYNVVVKPAALVSIGAASNADSYDGTTLHIPSVQVIGGAIYSNIAITVAGLGGIAGGVPAAPRDQYNPANRQLFIPAVEYGGKLYTNVTVGVGTVQ